MAGASPAFAFVRVPRGQARPSDEQLRAALTADRILLHQPPPSAPTELQVTGPHPITIAGDDLDEYVVWER